MANLQNLGSHVQRRAAQRLRQVLGVHGPAQQQRSKISNVNQAPPRFARPLLRAQTPSRGGVGSCCCWDALAPSPPAQRTTHRAKPKSAILSTALRLSGLVRSRFWGLRSRCNPPKYVSAVNAASETGRGRVGLGLPRSTAADTCVCGLACTPQHCGTCRRLRAGDTHVPRKVRSTPQTRQIGSSPTMRM